jgi:CheY-like chemotaxis protein
LTQTKVLLVDDDDNDLTLTRKSLERQDCEVVLARTVAEALKQIANQPFDVLITDLHMPDPGDGLAVVTAMRHTQPDVLNLVCSSYPDLQKAMDAIILQADKVLVKPFPAEQLATIIDERRLNSRPSPRPAKERVAAILDRDAEVTVNRWLSRVQDQPELAAIRLTPKARTGYLSAIIGSITARLRAARGIEDGKDCASDGAVAHGKLRHSQGYTPPMLVQESRILQVSIFETLQRNLPTVDFTTVLPDIMIIADEVDCQLRQAIDSFLRLQHEMERGQTA